MLSGGAPLNEATPLKPPENIIEVARLQAYQVSQACRSLFLRLADLQENLSLRQRERA